MKCSTLQQQLFQYILSLLLVLVAHAAICAGATGAEQAVQQKTISVTEIKKEESEGSANITLEAVEKARTITTERIYWLIGLWLLIVLAAVLIRWQLRDDEKLYQEGYYSKEL